MAATLHVMHGIAPPPHTHNSCQSATQLCVVLGFRSSTLNRRPIKPPMSPKHCQSTRHSLADICERHHIQPPNSPGPRVQVLNPKQRTHQTACHPNPVSLHSLADVFQHHHVQPINSPRPKFSGVCSLSYGPVKPYATVTLSVYQLLTCRHI